MKKIVNLFGVGVIILLLTSFFVENNQRNNEAPKIKSIGVKEEMILPEPHKQPLKPFVPDMVTYFNKNGGEDSTVLNFYTGEKIIFNFNVYDKKNRLDSVYNYVRGRELTTVESYEYDNKNNISIKTLTLYGDQNRYFYYYNKNNELIEEIGYNTNGEDIDTIYWHKFTYENGLLVEDENLFGNYRSRKHTIRYNERGDEIGAVITTNKIYDGELTDYSIYITKKYKYNNFGDWIECLVTNTVVENGEKETYNDLIRREIMYY